MLVIDDEPAIGRVAGESFDVGFCDLMMPGMTGMDSFEALLERNPALARRVVFVTGGAFTPRTTEFLRQTSNGTLSKPFDAVALKRIVADYLGSDLP